MNCHDIDNAISGQSPLPPQAKEHLTNCSRCLQLVSALNLPVHADPPSPETLRQIAEGIATNLRPVRPVASARYLFGIFIVIFVSLVVLGVYLIGAFALAVMTPLQAAAILSALAISTGLLAYSLVNQMVPGTRHRISPRVLPFVITISLMIAIAVLFRFSHERNFWLNSWACVRAGIPIGVLAAVPFWLVLRRGAVLSPRITGAAAGLLAGLAGTTALEIHCPNLDAWHILLSHLGVAILCALAGLVVGLIVEIAGRRPVPSQQPG
jgi:hypothetical protein